MLSRIWNSKEGAFMLITELVILCSLFLEICYCNTGSDEKNIKSYSSYPDEVQKIVKQDPILANKIKTPMPIVDFISNIVIFGVVFLIFGFFIRDKSFEHNFIKLLILGQSLNAFDFFVIDMLWWRNSKRVRFTAAKDRDIYKNPRKHLISFLKGILVFLIISIIDGLLLSLI